MKWHRCAEKLKFDRLSLGHMLRVPFAVRSTWPFVMDRHSAADDDRGMRVAVSSSCYYVAVQLVYSRRYSKSAQVKVAGAAARQLHLAKLPTRLSSSVTCRSLRACCHAVSACSRSRLSFHSAVEGNHPNQALIFFLRIWHKRKQLRHE